MVGGRPVVTRAWWDPDSFRRVSLPSLNNSVGWQGTETVHISKHLPFPCDKEATGPYPHEHNEEGSCGQDV